MIIESTFKPAWWLPNSHVQTIYPTLTRRIQAPVDLRERIELPDGDFIDLAWAINGNNSKTPLVILLHGLGGNVQSSYVGGLMQAFNRYGWRAVLMHFRGASEEPNRLLRAYHSGDTEDINYLLNLLKQREPSSKKAVVGISLGGNVLLKWLGEQGQQSLIDAAVAVSVPFQLRLVADRISQGFSRVYQGYLLRRLRQVFEQKKNNYTEDLPEVLQNIDKWQCFWTFDEFVTAPIHGFPNVHAYYRESSSRRYLRHIATPTLIIHALDDPFMTPEVLPQADELSSDITLELSSSGGHVGFISGKLPGKPLYWLEQRIPDYLQKIFAILH
ncbi:hydrolase of the alpha/beta-hydrolase fold family [Legionella donaldsonii]|uniref:Hydrolase of the alpha/beta-hydrolase fold family n=1 Tax=Legionella donaldsonii TaxID=45060 RepID=A0A378J0G8_9GAMM|nr:hydrolase [Legionella donaldsonii]STX41223.1 hydrolase of the alpha/beta-hydrolase fold family [Legionella donaldsonii]